MKTLKCKTLGAELAHPVQYEPENMSFLRLTLVDNGRQMKLSCTSTSINCKWPTWPCESEKLARTRERKLFSEIGQLKTFVVQRRLGW